MFTLPVPASATASHGSGSNESSLGSRQKGEKKKTHPSRVIARDRRRVRIPSVGNGGRRMRASSSRYGEGSVSKENCVLCK